MLRFIPIAVINQPRLLASHPVFPAACPITRASGAGPNSLGAMLKHFHSDFDYVVVTPGLVLSEHSAAAEARRARIIAIEQGFSDAVIMTRTNAGWEPL